MNRRAPAGLETEADAYEFLEQLRWGDDGPTICPHCGSDKGAWFLKPQDPDGRRAKGGSETRSPRRVWKCREHECRRQFSVLTNTVLHSTKMPVRAWVGAIFDLCADPDGVSARDIASRWGVTEKSAWAMLMRIQDALWSPEAAGASLASNAPLWFEVQAPDNETQMQAKRERRAAAVAVAEAQREAAQIAAARLQADVKRALAEAAAKDANPTKTGQPERTAIKKPRVAPVQKVKAVPEDRDDAVDQVRSDVERALAESFAEPLTPVAGRTPDEMADELGRGWLGDEPLPPDTALAEPDATEVLGGAFRNAIADQDER